MDSQGRPGHLVSRGHLVHRAFRECQGSLGRWGRRGFLDGAFRFLDRYVRGVAPAQADPAVTVQQRNGEGLWRAEEQWPPADVRPWSMPIRAGSYADEPGIGAGTVKTPRHRIRKKLGVDVIQTVRGLGYLLAPPDAR